MSSVVSSIQHHFESLPQWAKYVALAAPVFVGIAVLKRVSKRASPYKKDWQPGVVYLYQFQRSPAIPNISPFCLKLETWLRLANINYENVVVPGGIQSREGMMPFIEYNGHEYPDSGLVIRDLTKFLNKQSVEDHLTEEQKGASRALEVLMENSLLLSYAYSRYIDNADQFFTDRVLSKQMVGNFMNLKFALFKPIFKRMIKKRMAAAGIGRHPPDEIQNIGFSDLKAVSQYLGDKRFINGDTPTRVDATAFGLLAQIVYLPVLTPHLTYINTECGNIIGYCDRMKAKFWPDWQECCGQLRMDTNWKTRM